MILSPGAQTSGLTLPSAVEPRLEKLVTSVALLLAAPTTITSPLASAGAVRVLWPSLPLLPALLTRTTPSLAARSAANDQTDLPSSSTSPIPQLQLITL